MRAIEFYTTPSGEVTIKEQGQPERQLKESDTDFIQSFLEILEEFYPELMRHSASITPATTGINATGISWLYVGLSMQLRAVR